MKKERNVGGREKKTGARTPRTRYSLVTPYTPACFGRTCPTSSKEVHTLLELPRSSLNATHSVFLPQPISGSPPFSPGLVVEFGKREDQQQAPPPL